MKELDILHAIRTLILRFKWLPGLQLSDESKRGLEWLEDVSNRLVGAGPLEQNPSQRKRCGARADCAGRIVTPCSSNLQIPPRGSRTGSFCDRLGPVG